MIKNYLKMAWRNIAKNKIFAAINIIGLAIGISACLTIYLVASFEFSYDNFHPGKERIFRIVTEIKNGISGTNPISTIPDAATKVIRAEIPGLQPVAMFHNYYAKVAIPNKEKIIRRFDMPNQREEVSPVILAEPGYFDIFKYKWLKGNPATALNEPYHVVLTETEARKYFGTVPPDEIMGKEVVYNDSLRVIVAGIVQDWNKPTDFNFRDFISYSTIQNSFLKNEGNWNTWGGWNSSTQVFVRLADHNTAEQINMQFEKIVKDHMQHAPGTTVKFFLQPLSDIHFNGDFSDNYSRKAHLPTLYGLMAIAVFILIIAGINFVNLSTAQSFQRIKEVGIRKVLGSSRQSIVVQFLCEIFFLTVVAVFLSILIVKPVIHIFQSFLPQGVGLNLDKPSTWIFLLLLIAVTSLLAGFYPAKIMSGWLPVISLKGNSSAPIHKKGLLRKILIVFQFTISIMFIIGTLVISNQVRFMLNKDMGFAKDAIVNVNTERDYLSVEKLKVLADNLRGISLVQMVSFNQGPPADVDHSGTMIAYNDAKLQTQVLTGDENYVPLYQLKIIAGRNLQPSDTINELLINLTCARGLGFNKPEDAIGKLVDFGFSDGPVDMKRPIVGVLEDFHSQSLHDLIRPVTITTGKDRKTISVKLKSQGMIMDNFELAMRQIGTDWKDVFPNEKFEYRIFDDQVAKFYDSYRKTSQVMNAAMMISIFISCMGLFGLAAFTAELRTKEIGIRKVLGASVTGIVAMLSKDFLKLVLIAIVIASPVAYYFTYEWLQDFAYRSNISGWIFVSAGFGAIFIALITISFYTIKAAITNPVISLRTE